MGGYCSRIRSWWLKNPPFLSWQPQSLSLCYRTQSCLSLSPPVCLCNCIRFTWEVSAIGGGLPAWFDVAWWCWRSMVSSVSSPWTAFVSVDLRKTKNFWVWASSFDGKWGSFDPVPDVAGFFVLFSASSEYFHYCRLCLRNSLVDVVMAVLVVSASECSVWGLPSSRVSPMCTLLTGRYTACILLVTCEISSLSIHFRLSLTNAGVHTAGRQWRCVLRVQVP
jgi:hypothetical protein